MDMSQVICTHCGYIATARDAREALGVVEAARRCLGARNGTSELADRLTALSNSIREFDGSPAAKIICRAAPGGTGGAAAPRVGARAPVCRDRARGAVRSHLHPGRPAASRSRGLERHGARRDRPGARGRSGHAGDEFARGLGIQFEDKFKKYRLWQDPERILAESTPCQQANNVDPARARALVEETFGHRSAVPAPGDSPPS